MVRILIVLQALSLICAAIILIYHCCHRPRPCDSCKYLQRKGGKGLYQYTCKKPGEVMQHSFDRQPKYCAQWYPRNDQAAHEGEE